MIDETLTDAERVRLLALALDAMHPGRDDRQLIQIIAKLSGPETRLIARRAAPSRATPQGV